MPFFLARNGGILPDWTKGLRVEFVLIALVLQALVFGFFCGYIAQEKGRGYGDWFALGAYFSDRGRLFQSDRAR